MDEHTLSCNHGHCGSFCGGSCGGCGTQLELTKMEIDLLQLFAQTPFLPVVQQQDLGRPLFFDSSIGSAEALSAAITALHQKRLIQLDYDLPLLNYDYSDHEPCSRKGSMALTARGQAVVEQLEIQGIEV